MSSQDVSINVDCKCYAILRDALTGKIIQFEDDAVVVTAGKRRIADLVNGRSTVFFNYCAVGSGSATPTIGDVALSAELARNIVTSTSRNSTQAIFETFFTTAQAIGTVTESGLFDASANGTMLCRGNFEGINKTNTQTLTIVWGILFT